MLCPWSDYILVITHATLTRGGLPAGFGEETVTTPNRRCPFLTTLPECYCSRAQSIWAVLVVELCGGDLERCEYYRRNCQVGEAATAGPAKPESTSAKTICVLEKE